MLCRSSRYLLEFLNDLHKSKHILSWFRSFGEGNLFGNTLATFQDVEDAIVGGYNQVVANLEGQSVRLEIVRKPR